MILFELFNTEEAPQYQKLQISNNNRQYDFLLSIIEASISASRPFLSTTLVKALNYHAIACLHTNAGEYRPCQVKVGDYEPPMAHSVAVLMEDLVNTVNFYWHSVDTATLAAYALWKLNHIHPFINGNGRTARAACYFVVCAKSNGLLPGRIILPELIKQNRDLYVQRLKSVDENNGSDLSPLSSLISDLLEQQLNSANDDV